VFLIIASAILTCFKEAKDLPDWGKMQFRQYPAKPWREILKDVPEPGRDLAGQLVRFESSERLTAAKVSIPNSKTTQTALT
jgi:cyclin-dependent kinase